LGATTQGVEQGDESLRLDQEADSGVDIGFTWKESEKGKNGRMSGRKY